MREIKFRAWHSKYGYSSPFGIGGHPEWNDGMTVPYFSSVCQFEQFTGLLDKNGKEIYEGDILRYKKGSAVKKDTVIFAKGAFFCGYHSGSSTRRTIKLIQGKTSEVIRNIHENPELLNE